MEDGSAPRSYMFASITIVRAIALELERSGAPNPLGRVASRLDDDDARVSYLQFSEIVREAIKATGDGGLGLTLVCTTSPSALPLLHLLLLSCRNLREAWSVFVHYVPLVAEGLRWSLIEQGERTEIRFDPRTSCADTARFGAEFALGMVARTVQQFVPPPARPLVATWRHEKPSYTDRYRSVFNCAQRFGQSSNSLYIPSAWLDVPQALSDARLHESLRELADAQLAAVRDKVSLAERVRLLLLTLPENAALDIELIARRSGLRPRSLRRHLEREGSTLSTLRDEVRIDRACQALRNGMSIAEVAEVMGYSQASAFHRAFKRWTGATPSSYQGDPASREP